MSMMSKKVRQEEDDSYRNDVFESDSDDNDAELENVHDKVESNPSETGTYTVDKDDDSQTSPQSVSPAVVARKVSLYSQSRSQL